MTHIWTHRFSITPISSPMKHTKRSRGSHMSSSPASNWVLFAGRKSTLEGTWSSLALDWVLFLVDFSVKLFTSVRLGSLHWKEEYTRGNPIFAGVGLGSLSRGFLFWALRGRRTVFSSPEGRVHQREPDLCKREPNLRRRQTGFSSSWISLLSSSLASDWVVFLCGFLWWVWTSLLEDRH